MSDHSSTFERIAFSIEEQGYCIENQAIPETILAGLQASLAALHDDELQAAGVGRKQAHQVKHDIRSDRIQWIDTGKNANQDAFLTWMDELRLYLNRSLYLGLFDYESHFARYKPGAFYQCHWDAFKGRLNSSNNRILSTVLYLNNDWMPEDGGELLIYGPEWSEQHPTPAIERVAPTFGTLVVFLSDRFPHEVLPAQRTRLSIAGWFRHNDTTGTRLDPAH